MKLGELVRYRVQPGGLTHQQKLVRLLLVFLAVMLVLTVVSRAMDSLTVAQVTVEGPKSGTIEHRATADGVLEANREVALLALDGVLVDQVAVYQGAAVKEGDLLFQLSLEDLQRQLRERELEQQKVRLQLQEHNLQKEAAAGKEAEKKEKQQQRAEEDYDYTLEEQTERVRRAKAAKDDAAAALDAFRDDYDWDNWDDDHRYTGRRTHTIGASGEDEYDYDDDDFTYNGLTYSQAKEKFNTLKEAYEAAKQTLRDAERSQEKALLDAQRVVDDAVEEEQEDPDLQPQILSLNLQIGEFGMEKLREAIAAEGKILASVDGVVTQLHVSTGKRTGSEAAAVIAEATDGYRLRVPLDSEEAKLVSRGDKVNVTLSGKTRPVETVVESLTPSAGSAGGVDMVVMVPEGEVGQAATVEISKRSESYPQCVPIGAVHGSAGEEYVLVIDERETVLGTQKVARKVAVTVADSNETRAALSGGALQSTDKVIVTSSKNIFEGDVVRLMES